MFEGQPTLLCEASILGTISIFPNNGGISEFFSKNYYFKFDQMKEDGLTEKINLLNNQDLIRNNLINMTNYIESLLNKEQIIDKFKEIFVKQI